MRGVLFLLAVASASITITSCGATQIKQALAAPPSDKIVIVTCGGSVTLDSTLDVLDGVVFNATGSLTLVGAGSFPLFNIKGSAYIGGVTLKGGKGANGGCITSSNTAAANITLSDITFMGCQATGMGGGLFIQTDAMAELTRLRFWGCSAPRGGGLATATSSVPAVECDSCEFRNNTANGLGGGAVFLQDTFATFTKTLFSNNMATNNASGGAIYSLDTSLDCHECTFVDNVAIGRAGGVYADGATSSSTMGTAGSIRFVDSDFLSNNGSQRGAAIFACVHSMEELTVLNGAVCDNQLNQPDSVVVGSAIHVDCQGDVGLDTVALAGNLPAAEQFTAAPGTTLNFFQDSDVDTDIARETCELQQNITRFSQTPTPSSRIVSSATTHSVVVAFLLSPLLWL